MKIASSFGNIWLNANRTGLTEVSFTPISDTIDNQFTQQAAQELTQYLAGELQQFTVPLSIEIGTVFQKKVWHALLDVAYGKTATYLDIAEAVNSPKAVRAVGQANSVNPIPIIIPCHRVIGKNGKLVGYMGSTQENGLSIKKTLLTIENIAFTN